MVDLEKLYAMKFGETLEGDSPFQGLDSTEPLVWQLVEHTSKSRSFVLRWMDVVMGEVRIREFRGKLKMEDA